MTPRTATLDLVPLDRWFDGLPRPRWITGPCGAESERQILDTARAIAANHPDAIFRAGLWKPRTRPDSFEGVGIRGLPWMQRVRDETGLRIATEVACPTHVDACLEAGIDLLWIGARTTANPFSVQEVASALSGVDVPVLVKNPISPDLQLWMGGLERVNRAGVRRLGAVHRGFQVFDNGPFRNTPRWEMAIQLRTHHPQLPLVCDVSHIVGHARLIPYLAQVAYDLDFEWLMVETHIDPPSALSDAAQQITPADFEALAKGLVLKTPESDDREFASLLDALRDQIDIIDGELLELLARRMQVVKEIGQYKRDHRVTVLQLERLRHILEERTRSGRLLGLRPNYVTAVFNQIHEESVHSQTDIVQTDIVPTDIVDGSMATPSEA